MLNINIFVGILMIVIGSTVIVHSFVKNRMRQQNIVSSMKEEATKTGLTFWNEKTKIHLRTRLLGNYHTEGFGIEISRDGHHFFSIPLGYNMGCSSIGHNPLSEKMYVVVSQCSSFSGKSFTSTNVKLVEVTLPAVSENIDAIHARDILGDLCFEYQGHRWTIEAIQSISDDGMRILLNCYRVPMTNDPVPFFSPTTTFRYVLPERKFELIVP